MGAVRTGVIFWQLMGTQHGLFTSDTEYPLANETVHCVWHSPPWCQLPRTDGQLWCNKSRLLWMLALRLCFFFFCAYFAFVLYSMWLDVMNDCQWLNRHPTMMRLQKKRKDYSECSSSHGIFFFAYHWRHCLTNGDIIICCTSYSS